MDFYAEYKRKLRTPEQAVQVVKSGDWIDYGTNVCFPTLLDAALAQRRDELLDVKIRGNLCFGPIMTVESAPTEIFDVSVKLVAAIAFVKVITPSPIVTVPNVELAMSAMIVADAETLEKSMSSPSTGAEPSSQLPPVDILPSFAPPVQVLPATLPTERTSVLPETLQLEGRPSAVVIENFAPSAAGS